MKNNTIVARNNSIIIDFSKFSKLTFEEQKDQIDIYNSDPKVEDIYINFNELLYTNKELENIFSYIIKLNKRIILNGIKDENYFFIEYLLNLEKIKS